MFVAMSLICGILSFLENSQHLKPEVVERNKTITRRNILFILHWFKLAKIYGFFPQNRLDFFLTGSSIILFHLESTKKKPH